MSFTFSLHKKNKPTHNTSHRNICITSQNSTTSTNMENTINVKAFWVKSPEDKEIRRFTLDQEVATSFEYLRGKISTIFPSLMRQEFIVYWKDEENDMVSISSDEELLQALTFGTHGDLFRLTIQAASQDSAQTKADGQRTHANLEHSGVTCDGCEGQVVGLRFKCLVCPDHDLCENCCNQGLHNHHYMLRMATPAAPEMNGPRGPRSGCQGTQNPWWANFQGVGPWGGNMRRWWRNIMRQQQMQGGDGQANMRADSAPPPPPTQGAANSDAPNGAANSDDEQRDYLQHVGHQVQAILEPLGINVDVDIENRPNPSGRRRWQGQGGRGQGQGGRGQGGRGCARQPCANNEKCKPDGQCKKKCAQSGPCKPDEQCKKAGKCLRDPNANGPQVCPPRGCPPQAQAAEPMEIKVSDATEQPEIAPLVDLTSDGQAAASAPPQTMEVNVVDDEESQSWIKVEPCNNMDVVEVEKPEPFLYPSLNSVNAATNTSAPEPIVYPGQPSVSQALPADSTPPESAPVSSEPQGQASGQAQSSDQARASDAVPDAVTEMDRKVAEAIDQMRSMGFHDDGGWMTALLYQHQGDIYKVIDTVLKMAHTQNQLK